MRKTIATIAAGIMLLGGAAACTSDAEVASQNLSKDADNFKILRKIIFYNAITDTIILDIEGFCSIDAGDGRRMTVTCKIGEGQFKKHFLGESDNVTWVAEQLDAANVSVDHYKFVIKPEAVIPQVEVR